MGVNNAKHTPSPWQIRASKTVLKYELLRADTTSPWYASEHEANARLIAAAPDHALICWAMCVGGARWEPSGYEGRGEFCMSGICHSTTLDEFGAPVMTSGMRAAIAIAEAA